jgi:hypothetical protein
VGSRRVAAPAPDFQREYRLLAENLGQRETAA